MKALSIIIPMYNVEPFVERCLRSLEDQDISEDDYEIICINDGSPDKSREVVLRLQKEFVNIILIDQDNQGVSLARNNGIDRATGEYLMFIDPDDYVEENSLSRILKNVDETEIEVSFLGYTVLNENGTIRIRVLNESQNSKILLGIDTYYIARGDGYTDPDRMVAVLFKTDFLNNNNLRYLPKVPYLEDGELIARILCLAKRCTFDSNPFYQRITRQGSATNSKLYNSEKATNGFLRAADNLKKFQHNQKLNEEQKRFLNQPIAKFVLLTLDSSITWKSYNKYMSTVKALKVLTFRRVNLDGCNRQFHFLGRMYNLSPHVGTLALIIYPRLNGLYHFLNFYRF